MRILLFFVAWVLALLAGCCAKCEDGSAGNSTGPGEPIPGLLPAQEATLAPPADSCTGEQVSVDPTRTHVSPGTYCVCHLENATQDHFGSEIAGPHLALQQAVRIGPLEDEVVNVVLGTSSLSFMNFDAGRDLSAFVNYPHDAARGSRQKVTHLVKIAPFPPDQPTPESCGAGANVITIEFCFFAEVEGKPQWACSKDIGGGHFGDVHAKN